MSASAVPAGRQVRISRDGALGRLTLDRPAKLNALGPPMVGELAAVLDAWERDTAVHAVLLDGAGSRGLCAGGDLRVVAASAGAGDGRALQFWADEYRLVAKIAAYAKPIVVVMAGIVMGGGVGISAHTRHRIVTASTRLAMPEVGIGLVPDVGGTWLLSRAPGQTGTYLALTGSEIGAGDALAMGLADYFAAPDAVGRIGASLAREAPRDDAHVRALVTRFASPPPAPRLIEHRSAIDRCFAHDTVEAILAALDAEGTDFARAASGRIAANSPTSVKLTLRALREARGLADLRACLRLEFRLMSRLLAGHDVREGVRAAVIDKDRAPRWRPARLDAVLAQTLDDYFAPLGTTELQV